MTTSIAVTYYTYADGSSDKWYITVDPGSNTGAAEGLIGYGPNKPGSSGTWNTAPTSKLRQKQREKERKGYVQATHRDIPKPAIQEMTLRAKQMLKVRDLQLAPDGNLIPEQADAARQPASARPRRRSHPHKVWI